MSFDSLLVLNTGVPKAYFCVCCGSIVYPDVTKKDQASCDVKCLVCSACELYVDKCPDHNHPFTKSVRRSSMYGEIGKVFIRCENHATCKWTGNLSDYTLHRKSCKPAESASNKKGQNMPDLAVTTKEMAERYENAHFFWSWQDESVNGLPVLSEIKHQTRDMCAYFSVASVLEAMLRINGRDVKHLSWEHLYLDYIREKPKPNRPKPSKLITLAKILKEKGMVELSSDKVPLEPEIRHKISDFKMFKMNTKDGMEAAIDHINKEGPIVCVYFVTLYQRENRKSAGIIHGLENWKYICGVDEDEDTTPTQSATHAVCTIGIGAEDLTPWLHFQNSAGKDVQNGGFGRILPASIVEAIGFTINKDHERPSKRAKLTAQVGQSSTKGLQ